MLQSSREWGVLQLLHLVRTYVLYGPTKAERRGAAIEHIPVCTAAEIFPHVRGREFSLLASSVAISLLELFFSMLFVVVCGFRILLFVGCL